MRVRGSGRDRPDTAAYVGMWLKHKKKQLHLKVRIIHIPFTDTFARSYSSSMHVQALAFPDSLALMQIPVRGPTTTKSLQCGLAEGSCSVVGFGA